MRAPLSSPALLSLLPLLSLLACQAAHAGLGGRPSAFAAATAVHARQVAASQVATAPATQAATPAGSAYTVQETTLEGGTIVREYVDGAGQVFAVSWNGPFLPDLRTLLGQHFSALTGRAGKGRGRGPVRVVQDDLVIESSGHMRAWTGRAWLTSALPAGVSAEVIE